MDKSNSNKNSNSPIIAICAVIGVGVLAFAGLGLLGGAMNEKFNQVTDALDSTGGYGPYVGGTNHAKNDTSTTDSIKSEQPAETVTDEGVMDAGVSMEFVESMNTATTGTSEMYPNTDVVMPDFNTEEYNTIEENSFLDVATSPLSTFAMDVDTGSYTNFRRMVNSGYSMADIPSGAIRTEEMLNYFTYNFNNIASEQDNRFRVSYEIQDCPWNENNKVLAMNIETKDYEEKHNGNNFVFLIDSSGSMYDMEKGVLALRSFELLAETLTEEDTVSIVTYSGDSRVILKGCRGDNLDEIEDALSEIDFGGGTNGSGGIEAAYEMAEKYFIEGGNNRVIIASDGDMNLGITDQSGLVDLIEEKKETGVFLTVLGYGSGNYSDANMESIANAGNGNYYYIDCLDEAKYVLVDKLKQSTITVAKDVKLQMEFNPTKVASYRLLGYENRTMAAEDFDDDTKDGGETGAGQQVTVLYELVLVGDGASTSDLKYQGDRELKEDAYSDEIGTLSIRYKDPDKDESVLESHALNETEDMASEDFNFACGVVELSMLLRNSQYAENIEMEDAYALINENSAGDERREELAELVDFIM